MSTNIFWFRRDLRLEDNAGLYHALKSGNKVQCIFIFDPDILNKLEDKQDARVEFLVDRLQTLNKQLKNLGASLWVFHNKVEKVWRELISNNNIEKVFFNRDYESYALERDQTITRLLESKDIQVNSSKDHVIFEGDEVLKDDDTPYTVFTPYKSKWLAKLETNGKREKSFFFKSYPTEKYFDNLKKANNARDIPSLEDLGFVPTEIQIPGTEVTQSVIKNYEAKRDIPSIRGTSQLGLHYRFGSISIREKARKSYKLSATYLSELIWRDFYSQILQHFPHVEKGCFRKKYEGIMWRNNEDEFKAWCEGKTGYHIVDAGMRELNSTGFMHNRVRMITASFLTKHLLIDWRWGEAYFATKLLDFDLASNNGGWQWAAGCGTDAAPYFRIFNPDSQQKKFDPEFRYIKKWVPEWGTNDYPDRIVDHKEARERCLRVYKDALNQN